MNTHEDFMEKFAILIPVYNEQNNVIKLAQELEKLEVPYMFVDDGSTDKTVTALWFKDFPALCYFPRRGKTFAIQIGVKYLLNAGYDWVLLLNKKSKLSDIEKLDEALFWKLEENKIFTTQSGSKLIHKDIWNQLQGKWFDLELKWKIWRLKWKVNKVV